MRSERTTTLLWLAAAALVWLAVWGWNRWRPAAPAPLATWQAPVGALTSAQQQTYRALQEAEREAERRRARGEGWPETLGALPRQQQRGTVNYAGTTEGLAWLVMILEPQPGAPKDAAQPDDEHHLLPDGTMLHVTVWTRAEAAGPPDAVTAFPAAEGWVQRLAR